MKFLAIISLFMFINITFASDKVEITRPENSTIQKITIDGDVLTVKTKDKVYSFNLSELIKETTSSQASQSANEWFFFVEKKGNSNSFQYVNMNRRKVFHTGELFKRFKKNDKYYVRDLENNIFIPTWEVSKDFSSHLVPAQKYIDFLNNKIKSIEKTIESLSRRIAENERKIKRERERYIAFLQANNIETTLVDDKGNIIRSSTKYDSKIKRQLRKYYDDIKTHERENKNFKLKLHSLSSQLNYFRRLKKKIDAIYTANVIGT